MSPQRVIAANLLCCLYILGARLKVTKLYFFLLKNDNDVFWSWFRGNKWFLNQHLQENRQQQILQSLGNCDLVDKR
ncbi:hypothetical protein BDF21DRAFT_209898 [Thamnidium elegans]|nr:hypothetical protein BDF21DRAFT_209898 [Thamnidium elegans]